VLPDYCGALPYSKTNCSFGPQTNESAPHLGERMGLSRARARPPAGNPGAAVYESNTFDLAAELYSVRAATGIPTGSEALPHFLTQPRRRAFCSYQLIRTRAPWDQCHRELLRRPGGSRPRRSLPRWMADNPGQCPLRGAAVRPPLDWGFTAPPTPIARFHGAIFFRPARVR